MLAKAGMEIVTHEHSHCASAGRQSARWIALRSRWKWTATFATIPDGTKGIRPLGRQRAATVDSASAQGPIRAMFWRPVRDAQLIAVEMMSAGERLQQAASDAGIIVTDVYAADCRMRFCRERSSSASVPSTSAWLPNDTPDAARHRPLLLRLLARASVCGLRIPRAAARRADPAALDSPWALHASARRPASAAFGVRQASGGRLGKAVDDGWERVASMALTAEREEYNAFVSPRLCRGTGAGGAALEMTNVEN